MNEQIERLKKIVKRLRAPDGCPWDIEQTMKSITPHIIEEAYELVDAIQNGSADDIKEEIGDSLLHATMLCEMADEENQFDLEDAAKHVSDKMIYRHPHVFDDKTVDSVDEVWQNWEALKAQEKKTDSILDSIPNHFPALMRALKIQKKAARVGFDWPDMPATIEKLDEEIEEFKDAISEDNKDNMIEEAGDLLFSLVNVLRKHKIDPEEALQATNKKFISRFHEIEAHAKSKNVLVSDMTLEQMDTIWNHAKSH